METFSNAITKNESFEAVLEDARDGSSYQEDSSDGSIFMFIGISVAVLAGIIAVIVGVVSKANKNKQLYFSDGNNEIPTMEHVNPFVIFLVIKISTIFITFANKKQGLSSKMIVQVSCVLCC